MQDSLVGWEEQWLWNYTVLHLKSEPGSVTGPVSVSFSFLIGKLRIQGSSEYFKSILI